jgi:DNA helicase HerA-like ATPase
MSEPTTTNGRQFDRFSPRTLSQTSLESIEGEIDQAGGVLPAPVDAEGAVGFTHFDAADAQDDHVVVLMTSENIEQLPMQSLVRIRSAPDPQHHVPARDYLGVVTAGPFAEPDGLRADSSIVVATTTQGRGRILLPRYHGRAFVQILGEEIEPGKLVPHRYRPRPNSPVFPLSLDETTSVLRVGGDAQLGALVGNQQITVAVNTRLKSVLPRHMGILGTTGSGKSTTVARLVHELQRAGAAVVIFDVEGEYTEVDQPTDHEAMLAALRRRDLQPQGVPNLHVYHLVGRQTSREGPQANVSSFRLDFADLSPHAVMEILDLSEAQQTRFLKAYDVLKLLMRDLQIFPRPHNEADYQRLLDLDELESGYPEMTLAMLRDVVNVCLDYADHSQDGGSGRRRSAADDAGADFQLSRHLYSPQLKDHVDRVKQFVARSRPPGNLPSWMSLLGKLNRLARLNVFDNPRARPLSASALTRGGNVSVIDLSDTDSPAVNNLVIAALLRQIQLQQELNFRQAAEEGRPPTATIVFIEEAHEFLSAARIRQMPTLFEQVARIAKRGRKRWLGLVFVTQLPQHLPDDILGLVNNYVIHKIADTNVLERLRRSIANLDRSQWGAVPALAPGQAIVSLTSATRPVMVAIDPAPCRLRLVE